MQRSGTTLVRSLLSAHRNITIAPETHFLNDFRHSSGLGELRNREEFESFWNTFSASPRFHDLRLDRDIVEARIIEEADFRFRSVFRVVLEEYARQAAKPRWGEKTPHHRDHLEELLEWFPDARVVFMVRDPRAVCASLCRVPWRRAPTTGLRSLAPRRLVRLRRIIHDAALWQSSLDKFEGSWGADPRLKVFRYEDLVEHGERALRDLCRFLGEDFDEAMLGDRTWGDVIPPTAKGFSGEHASWRHSHVEKTLMPLSQASISKWRQQLSELEVRAVEGRCSSGMISHGYAALEARTVTTRMVRSASSLINGVMPEP